MEMLCSSSVTLQWKLVQLSPSGRSLTAVAHIFGIETVCSAVSDFTGPSSELPVLSVCVDTTQAQAGLGIIVDDAAVANNSSEHAYCEEDVSGATLLPLCAEFNAENLDISLFSLQPRVGTISWRVVAKSRTLQNLTIALPDSARLVFGPGSGAVHLKIVTLQGAMKPHVPSFHIDSTIFWLMHDLLWCCYVLLQSFVAVFPLPWAVCCCVGNRNTHNDAFDALTI